MQSLLAEKTMYADKLDKKKSTEKFVLPSLPLVISNGPPLSNPPKMQFLNKQIKFGKSFAKTSLFRVAFFKTLWTSPKIVKSLIASSKLVV